MEYCIFIDFYDVDGSPIEGSNALKKMLKNDIYKKYYENLMKIKIKKLRK